MSKTILLSGSIEATAEFETGLEFGDDILNILWPEIERNKTNYPIMWEVVQDFYGDFMIEPANLQQLIREIEQLLKTYSKQVEVSIWLEVLKTLASLGINYNLRLIGIAD